MIQFLRKRKVNFRDDFNKKIYTLDGLEESKMATRTKAPIPASETRL